MWPPRPAPDQLLAIDDALAKLAREDPSAAKLVELRYFAGLTVDEAGKALGMSHRDRLQALELRPRLAPWRASRNRGVVSRERFFFTFFGGV